MKKHQLLMSAVLIAVFIGLLPQPAMAYVGPGAGLSAIGLFLAIVVGVIVAIAGFLWYPIKRILRACRKRDTNEGDENDSVGEAE